MAFGHHQLGGVAPLLAEWIKKEHGFKYHWALADYLQRSARHIASQTDAEQAYAIGRSAVEHAIRGDNNVMLTIERNSNAPYQWSIGTAPLKKVANVEHKMPREYISEDGFSITDACRQYLQPLTEGEAYPPYKNGMPSYVKLKKSADHEKIRYGF